MLHIAVEREGQPRKELRFAKDVVVVGREPEHDLQLNFEDGASRQHARLSHERGQHFVEDLGSRNGTKVNGKRITAKTPIKAGDEVEVGKVKIYLVGGRCGRQPRHRARPAADRRRPDRPAHRQAGAQARQGGRPEPAPKARPAPEPARPAPKAPRPAPEPKLAFRTAASASTCASPSPSRRPPAEPEGKPTGPINDENEACRSQIDPLARRWRDLGKPEGCCCTAPCSSAASPGRPATASCGRARPSCTASSSTPAAAIVATGSATSACAPGRWPSRWSAATWRRTCCTTTSCSRTPSPGARPAPGSARLTTPRCSAPTSWPKRQPSRPTSSWRSSPARGP
ncbi:FHA domain-containing protein [Nannocystis pusilla]|uniref:FHA domain-containing protein n=1 Tax=Nannocystis pusilla TaxID=889268 RepID=UPI003B75DB51